MEPFISSIMNDKLSCTCPICLEQFNDIDLIPKILCRRDHLCCQNCYQKVRESHKICPQCREQILSKSQIRDARHIMGLVKAKDLIKDETQRIFNELKTDNLELKKKLMIPKTHNQELKKKLMILQTDKQELMKKFMILKTDNQELKTKFMKLNEAWHYVIACAKKFEISKANKLNPVQITLQTQNNCLKAKNKNQLTLKIREHQSEQNNIDSQVGGLYISHEYSNVKMSQSIHDGIPDIYLHSVGTKDIPKLGRMGRNLLESLTDYQQI